jgi:hypothetical protein
MHSDVQQRKPELFEDIFELGVDDAYDPTGKRWLKSIIFSGAAVVFDKSLWSVVTIEGVDARGSVGQVRVPLLNEVALVLSKAKSVQNEKRTRDAFDIYYVFCGPQRDQIVVALRQLASEYSAVREQLDQLNEWILKNQEGFSANVSKYANIVIANAAQEIIALLSEIRSG